MKVQRSRQDASQARDPLFIIITATISRVQNHPQSIDGEDASLSPNAVPVLTAQQTSSRRASTHSSASSRPRASRRTRRPSAGAGSACSRPRTRRARSLRRRTRRAGTRRRRCGRAQRASSACRVRSSRSGRRSAGGGCSCEGSSCFWLLRDCRYKIQFFATRCIDAQSPCAL
jgi:hypothetical protein